MTIAITRTEFDEVNEEIMQTCSSPCQREVHLVQDYGVNIAYDILINGEKSWENVRLDGYCGIVS